jgi:hypothetical protein
MDADQIRERRQQVLQELAGLVQMRRGSVVEQYREVSRPGARGKGRIRFTRIRRRGARFHGG